MNHALEQDLMSVEMRLVENLADAMNKFAGQITGINESMDTKTSAYFQTVTQ